MIPMSYARLISLRVGCGVELTSEQRAELSALVNSADVSAAVATRARIVLWRAEGRPKVEVAALAGVSRPTVDLWLSRFAAGGVAGLLDRSAQSSRGLGFALRSTASSWRSTSSSMSLDEVVRPSRASQRRCGVPEVGTGALTSVDRWSDMIPACRCGCCT